MKRYLIIVFTILCTSLPSLVSAIGETVSGRDFWIYQSRVWIYWSNSNQYINVSEDTTLLYIVGDTACTGYVENVYFNYHQDFSVLPNIPTIVKVPKTLLCSWEHMDAMHLGIFIHSERNVFLYCQYESIIPALFNYEVPSQCDYLCRPITYPFLNYKIPIVPIPFNSTSHLDVGSDWPFVTIGSFYVGDNMVISALEDSTQLFVHGYVSSNFQSATDTVYQLNKGESVRIFLPTAGYNPFGSSTDSIRFHTNCKNVAVNCHFLWISSPPLNCIEGDHHPYLTPSPLYTFRFDVLPLTTSKPILTGHDYLCKKLQNNRFDKGIYFNRRYGFDLFFSDNQPFAAYNYNEYYPDYSALAYFQQSDQEVDVGSLITGNHRSYWGDTDTFVNVPYTFLRSEGLHETSALFGPAYIIHKKSRPGYIHYGYMTDPEGCGTLLGQHVLCTQPAERMVKYWLYPTTRDNIRRLIVTTDGDTVPGVPDSLYVDVQIYTHADGIGSTYFNGQLIPPTAFDTFPLTHGEYWVTQLYFYNDDIPELIRIENEHGFSAYVDEFGYNVGPVPWGHPEVDDITYMYYYLSGASGYHSSDAFQNCYTGLSIHNNDTVYRCVGDTLHLRVEHNPDSVPVEWIYNGDSYPYPELSFLLPQVDTLTVQLMLHYDGCPDTSTTFVAVVPPPVFEVCHDDTLCHGAQLSVQQPNVLSYLWSTGAHTPAITLDSAGTYSVTVTNLGCKAESDLFTIDLYPQSSVEFGNDSILCELATLLLDATQPHPAQYVWQDQSTNTTYTVYEDGQYWVVVTDHCLGASDTIAIGYLTDFTVDLGPDTTLCEGRTLVLSAGVPFCDYEWQDGSTQPTYLVRHSGTYSVTASNQCFEHGDDIVVEYEPCDQELWMPNSFTPNGDGLNDLFLPVFAYPDEVESFEMTIYDRGGIVQYMTRRLDQGWDAAGVPIGTYVVFIRYKSKGQETRDVTGSVTVVR